MMTTLIMMMQTKSSVIVGQSGVSSLGFGVLCLIACERWSICCAGEEAEFCCMLSMWPGAISGLRDPSLFIDFGVQFSLSEKGLSRFLSPWVSISGTSSDCSLCARSASTNGVWSVNAPGPGTQHYKNWLEHTNNILPRVDLNPKQHAPLFSSETTSACWLHCDTLFKWTARGVDKLRNTQLAWDDPRSDWLDTALPGPVPKQWFQIRTLTAGTRRVLFGNYNLFYFYTVTEIARWIWMHRSNIRGFHCNS